MFVAAMVHRRREVKLSAAHLLWMGAIFINQINFWLGSYVFHKINNAAYATIAFVIVFPVLLYLQSALVVTDTQGSMDMRAHHERNKRAYIGLVIAATLLDACYFGWVASQDRSFNPLGFLAADGLFVATGAAALLNNNRLVQIAVPGLHLALRLLGFFLSSQPLITGA
jgi:hypothetical protein